MSLLDRSTRGRRATAPAPRGRDVAVDVARALCLVVVVALHAMMVGVSLQDGVPVLENAMDRWAGFAPASWVVQVMPLFFLLGGFSAHRQWTRLRAEGVRPRDYVASRLRRLLPAAVLAAVVVAGVLVALRAAGVPEGVVGEAGFRIGQPLWFLGVYVLCTALVPVMAALHQRHRTVTLVVLAAAVVAVDAVRLSTGVDAVGLLNLLFVWVLLQQGGFLLADGTLARATRGGLAVLGLTALGLLAATVAAGVYPADLYVALNPPTGALVLLGVAQLCLFQLARPLLSALPRVPRVARAVDAINGHAMTLYSWHMAVLVLGAGAMLLVPAPLPVPLSADWWASRPLWLLGAGVVIALVVRALGPVERGRGSRGVGVGRGRTVAAVLCGMGGVVAILAATGSVAAWIVGAGLLLASWRLVATGERRPVSAR